MNSSNQDERLSHIKLPSLPVTDKKIKELKLRYIKLNLNEDDLEESYTRGAGNGGQKINKSNNCVLLKHLPSQTVIKCHKERTQALNRFFARRLLCDALERAQNGGLTEKEEKARDKIRKKKKRKARRLKSDKDSINTGQND